MSCFPFVFLRAPSIRWPAMVSVAGTQANVCTKKSTAAHNHFTTLFFLLVQSSLSILCRFVHGVQRPPQEAMFVVRYTKLSTVHDFKNRRVRWQLLNSCTEHCWSERRRRRGVNVAPSFTASLPHSRPSPFSHLLLRVSDDKLAPF